jgi:small subunit ribosomal protein S16
MKMMGRKHRPFFRVCAMDCRAPRDGRVIEELGTYDPMVPETDARAILNGDRIDYWLGVGAQPSPKVAVLIRKYGSAGSHLEQQQAAIGRLGDRRSKAIEEARAIAARIPKPKTEEESTAEAASATEESAAPEAASAEHAVEETATPEAAAEDNSADATAAADESGHGEAADEKKTDGDEAKSG